MGAESGVAAPVRTTSSYIGGAGLAQRGAALSAFPRWIVPFTGVSALVFVALVAGLLVLVNPAFGEGRAGGTADRIGQLASPGGAAEAPVELTPDQTEGKRLIGTKGCGGCHVVPGIAAAKGSVGPSLAGVASRTKIAGGAVSNTGPDDLKRWIMNPPAVKPGTGMPNLGLNDDEATKIVSYLETLKSRR